MPFSDIDLLGPQQWLFDGKGQVLHDRTGGEYDIVVWHARGKGAPSSKTDLTMLVQKRLEAIISLPYYHAVL